MANSKDEQSPLVLTEDRRRIRGRDKEDTGLIITLQNGKELEISNNLSESCLSIKKTVLNSVDCLRPSSCGLSTERKWPDEENHILLYIDRCQGMTGRLYA